MFDVNADRTPRRRRVLLGLAAAVLAGAATIAVVLSVGAGRLAPATSSAGGPCALYASPSGSDSASGSLTHPFRTAQKLVDAVGVGEAGCLRAGRYSQTELSFAKSITLQSYPGEIATLTGGLVYVPSGVDDVTIKNLRIDTAAATQVGVQVMSRGVRLIDNDITNQSTRHTCIILGSNVGWGRAQDTVIKGNVIHQCGSPRDGNQDHAIYFDNSRGATVTDNIIWGASAYAIHLYENAHDNEITHNVIADNGYGVIFADNGALTSNGNRIADNIIADSSSGYNASSWWGGKVGTGNLLQSNCFWSGNGGDVQSPADGFTASGNVTANPGFVDPEAHDYRLKSGHACLPVVGYDTAAKLADTVSATAASSSASGSATTPSSPTVRARTD